MDCGLPRPPVNGNLGSYSRTTEGANVTFRCNRDIAEMVSVCTSDGMWDPVPEEHNCKAIKDMIHVHENW